jgi:hypothetical protein
VFDVDWYLSILDKSDMANICQKFKLNVTGFQRNLNNAPIKTLGNAIKTALNNGFQKKRGNKNDHLPFEDMLADVAKEIKTKYPKISEMMFEEFAIYAELEIDLSIYQIVSILYHQFPEEYKLHYESIVANTKENLYIFHGLSEELSKTPIEKIYKILGANNIDERNIKLLKQFEEDCFQLPNKEIYHRIKELMLNEEAALRVLVISDKDIHVFVSVAFLLENERYKNESYQALIQSAVLAIHKLELERLNQKLEYNEEELTKVECKLQALIEEKEKLEKENSGLMNQLTTLVEKETDSSIAIELLSNQKTILESVLHKNEPLQMVFLRIITENNFTIVTNDVEHFVGTPFESVTILPSQFKKELKTKSHHSYKEQTVFITRSSFSTGTNWYQFKQILEKHELHFEELGQYEITCYIQEIIQYLSRKEVLVYADEI